MCYSGSNVRRELFGCNKAENDSTFEYSNRKNSQKRYFSLLRNHLSARWNALLELMTFYLPLFGCHTCSISHLTISGYKKSRVYNCISFFFPFRDDDNAETCRSNSVEMPKSAGNKAKPSQADCNKTTFSRQIVRCLQVDENWNWTKFFSRKIVVAWELSTRKTFEQKLSLLAGKIILRRKGRRFWMMSDF